MEKILLKEKIRHYCSNCKKEVENVWIIKINSIIGTKYVLLCTDCQKLMGVYCHMDFIKYSSSKEFFNESYHVNYSNEE